MLDLWRSGGITAWQLMGAEWLYDSDQQRSEFNVRSASNCRYPMKLIFPSDGFIARLGLIAKVVQQFLQKLTPPLDDAQN